LNAHERRSFLAAIFDHPAQPQGALELLVAAQAAMKRKFSPQQQRLLDSLLEKNARGKLRPKEHRQLDELMAEYGAGLIDKARANYVLRLAQQAAATDR
jgi:uncharacterized protein YbgA (DUF1722 family)